MIGKLTPHMSELFTLSILKVTILWLDCISYRAWDWIVYTEHSSFDQFDPTGWVSTKGAQSRSLSLRPSFRTGRICIVTDAFIKFDALSIGDSCV